jgi:formamidopyrimidine-DNA glycosylase
LGKSTGKSIFEIMLQNKACFNGFGLNLATEALHRARIHPMWSSQLVFQQPILRERLLLGLKAVATEDIAWNKYIPQHSYLDDPFHYNERAIEFYQQHINQVYDKHYCLVPKDICLTLYKEGLLVFHFCFTPPNSSLHFHLSVLRLLYEKVTCIQSLARI